ncbi:unnamed protein product, partial [Amoebophrya sp. A25]
ELLLLYQHKIRSARLRPRGAKNVNHDFADNLADTFVEILTEVFDLYDIDAELHDG